MSGSLTITPMRKFYHATLAAPLLTSADGRHGVPSGLPTIRQLKGTHGSLLNRLSMKLSCPTAPGCLLRRFSPQAPKEKQRAGNDRNAYTQKTSRHQTFLAWFSHVPGSRDGR